MAETPDFIAGSTRLSEVFAFAHRVHDGPRSPDSTEVAHPLQVARILHRHRYDDDVIAAALLHDAVEDTPTGLGEIARRFGVPVARLVSIMTEDDTIQSYAERKAEHRRRLAGGGEREAAIFAADKLAKLGELRRTGETVPAQKLDHYEQCVRMLAAEHADVPFLDELTAELAAYRRECRDPAGVTAAQP
jgi:(p)ppGpp synthase/HD superfamily hydrolase